MNTKKTNIISLSVLAVILLCTSFSQVQAGIQTYRNDLKQAVRTLPEHSIVLQLKLLAAGKHFEAVGIFSQARRTYQYLDLVWEKYPPADDEQRLLLKKKIVSLKKKKDTPKIGALTLVNEDTLSLYQKVYHPGQQLECRVTQGKKGGVWLSLTPVHPSLDEQDKNKHTRSPILFPGPALDNNLQVQLPDVPAEYYLNLYDSNGLFLTQTRIWVQKPVKWAEKLKIETSGYPGLGGTSIAVGDEFKTIVHNTQAWLAGVKGKRPWVGLFKKDEPVDSKKHMTYWYIKQNKKFTRINCRIKEAGEYQLRVFSDETNKRKVLLKVDLRVGEPRPIQVVKGFNRSGPSLSFAKKQWIEIAGRGLGLDPAKNPDPYCLVVPSWFVPGDIRHGINHAMSVSKNFSGKSNLKLALPDTGGSYDILYYPHWRALKSRVSVKKLARVEIKAKDAVSLVLPQAHFLPGANIRAGISVGAEASRLNAYIIHKDYLQMGTSKARYVRNERHAVSLDTDLYTHKGGWFDITAPLIPGQYFLAVYNQTQLCAAQPLTIVSKTEPGALIQMAKGPYQTNMPLNFKIFPPVKGIAEYAIVQLKKDDTLVLKKNLYKQYMDYPSSIKAPQEAGTYQILFFVKGDEEPQARGIVTFLEKENMPGPKIDPGTFSISPEAIAAFGQKALIEDADFARFNLFASRFVPKQEMLINYSIPEKLTACLVLLPEGPAPDSLAQAIAQALEIKELDYRKNLVTLKAPGPGSYRLYVFDTLQWSKAGSPSLITQIKFEVEDVYHVKISTPDPAFANGRLVLTAALSPDPGFFPEFKTVYLYPKDINTIHNRPGSLAKAGFKKIKENFYQATLLVNVEPGEYQLFIDNHQIAYPIRLEAPQVLDTKSSVSITHPDLIPNESTTIEFHPSLTWKNNLFWALAGKDEQGNMGFIHPPDLINNKSNRVVQTEFKAPVRIGQYRVCFWEGTGKETFSNLPDASAFHTVNVRLDPAYQASHQPAVELQAYFAQNKDLYAGMHTTGRFTASIAYDPSAWIGILPDTVNLETTDSGLARESALYRFDLKGKDRGDFSFVMPENPGRYQLCMYDSARNGRRVLQRTITLAEPDMAKLEQEANARADQFLDSLPDYDQDINAIKKIHQDQYEQHLELPVLTPILVSPELLKQLEGKIDSANPTRMSQHIMALFSPSPASAAAKEKRDCEADLDLALENMRKVNINFGDGLDLRNVVGELATKMATDLVMGQKHIAQAKQYYDKTQAYYDKAMKLKSSAKKNGWENTVKGALWDSTKSMLNTCVTGDCLSRLGRKAIEHKLKGYNPRKMSPEDQATWKKEYTRMVVLLDENDLEKLKKKTAKFADLAGKLSVPDPDAKAIEMARATAINAMKGATMSMVNKIPGWSAVKAYYETLNVLRGALIDSQTKDFMDKYRNLRDEGGTISQVNDILGSEGANHLRTSLRNRIEANPKGYKPFLTRENRRLAIQGKPISLDAAEIDKTIMGHLEKWYQKEKKDKTQDKFYQDMKDAWYNSQCNFESYMKEVKSKSFFDTVKEGSSHAYGKMSGLLSGNQTYSSIKCTRKALAFRSYLDLRAQVLEQMAGWHGKNRVCQPGTIENNRLQDQLVCEALINPGSYKKIMAANAQACGALPKPLPPKSTPKVKQLSKKAARAIEVLLKRSGNIDVLKCLCSRHSIMGSGCSYHPAPTQGRSGSCDKPGPPCIQGNWGCGRRDMATDSNSLQACQVGKAIREFKRKDSKGYQTWKEQRKQYMAK